MRRNTLRGAINIFGMFLISVMLYGCLEDNIFARCKIRMNRECEKDPQNWKRMTH